ncbi:PorP/SprF family type IX secretion system membrane protein [Fulvitalea axinellae]|uniref:PorP/SprF family type IX secretion system membrane protein n=1 Tax=Fulvitalea axinellae TaxID=1182444 RepID=UPI0030CA24D2
MRTILNSWKYLRLKIENGHFGTDWFVLCLTFCFMSMGRSSVAQEIPEVIRFDIMPSMVNPAWSGSQGGWSASMLYQPKMLGFESAPQLGAFSFQKSIGSTLGTGLAVSMDKRGPEQLFRLDWDLSSTFAAGEKSSWAFGLRTSVSQFTLRLSSLKPSDGSDPYLGKDIENDMYLDFSAGVGWYSKNAYLGLSVANFYRAPVSVGDAQTTYNANLHVTGFGGVKKKLGYYVVWEPSLLVSVGQDSPLSGTVISNFLFAYETFGAGAFYRSAEVVGATVDYRWELNRDDDKTIMIYYAFGAPINGASLIGTSSHEIGLRISFNKKRNKKPKKEKSEKKEVAPKPRNPRSGSGARYQ